MLEGAHRLVVVFAWGLAARNSNVVAAIASRSSPVAPALLFVPGPSGAVCVRCSEPRSDVELILHSEGGSRCTETFRGSNSAEMVCRLTTPTLFYSGGSE